MVEATVFVDVEVFGHRAQVKDRGDGKVPLCVTSSGPTVVLSEEC